MAVSDAAVGRAAGNNGSSGHNIYSDAAHIHICPAGDNERYYSDPALNLSIIYY